MHVTTIRLMVAVVSRMWTPFITRRTTESLTCWTSVTWRAGEDDRLPRSALISPVLFSSDFKSSQGPGSDCRINGVQHLVYKTLLQRPAYRKYAGAGLYMESSHMTETPANLQLFQNVLEI